MTKGMVERGNSLQGHTLHLLDENEDDMAASSLRLHLRV